MKTLLKTIYLFLLVNPFLTTIAQITFNPSNNSTPVVNANSIALNANIVLNFSAAIKTSTATAGNIRITGKNTGIIAGVYSGGTTTQVTFNPTNNFFAGEVITVTLTSGVQDASSNPLTNPTSFSFTTKSNLSSFTPSWTATDIVNQNSANNASADGAFSVFAADLDNDGDIDIVLASIGDNTIAWYENTNGDASAWTTRTITNSANYAWSVFVADLDNDGDLDIVWNGLLSQTIGWYENTNGDASAWSSRRNITDSPKTARQVFAADIDNDGDNDIILATLGDVTIAWYENNLNDDDENNRAWTARDINTTDRARGAQNVFAADLDNDGDIDLASAYSIDDTIAWYQNSNNTIWDGSVDNSWATADNWSNGVPVTNSDVTIPASLANYPTAANAVAVRSVTLASGTSLIASNTFSGAITYNRNLATNNWYTVSSPVVNETYDNAYVTANGIASGANNNKAIATYVTNGDSWDYMQAGETATFASGTGYSVKRTNAGDISFTGTMKVNNTTIALTTAGNGYNLIGNPYPSFINSADILTNNTDVLAAQTIWVWNQATSTYVAKVTGQAFKIAPGQGFIVKSDGSAGNVVINESYQSHQTTDTFLRTEARPGISLTLTDNSISRQTQIYYIDGTTAGYDNGYDGQMFGGVANEFAIYTHFVSKSDGDDYAIQSLPNNNYENMIVPVGINAVSGKTITITAAAENLPEEINIYLEDKDNDSFTLLDAAANYSTTLENNLSGIGRFYLHTSTAALSANDFATNNNISIYSSSKENLRIAGIQNGKKAKLQLYNVLGKEILRTSFEGNGVNNVSLPTLNTGVYIVKIATENRTLNKKIHIK
jgi:hypothetical protein